MRRHFYKRAEAIPAARLSISHLMGALQECHKAEHLLKQSGHKGAEHGVHQASLRLFDWMKKVKAELDWIEKGEDAA